MLDYCATPNILYCCAICVFHVAEGMATYLPFPLLHDPDLGRYWENVAGRLNINASSATKVDNNPIDSETGRDAIQRQLPGTSQGLGRPYQPAQQSEGQLSWQFSHHELSLDG